MPRNRRILRSSDEHERIIALLKRSRSPLGSKAIHAAMRRPEADYFSTVGILATMCRQGKLISEGDKGSKTFRIAGSTGRTIWDRVSQGVL